MMTLNLREFGLFRQLRVGYEGKEFLVFKIKTMVTEPGLSDDGVASISKHRITKLGRILRKMHLDELPQLFSVFLGKMSIIGPRPEMKSIMHHLNEDDRNSWVKSKPGLISPATLSFINEEVILSEEDDPHKVYIEKILPRKAEMNREYSENINFQEDLRIFFNYIRIILKNE